MKLPGILKSLIKPKQPKEPKPLAKPKQSKELMPGQKKKINKMTLIILAVLALFVLYLAAAMGAALDMSADNNGDVEFGLFVENIAHTLTAPDIVTSALGAGGYAPQMVFLAAVAMGIFALYKYSMIKKRLHRKGVEHGSAQWGA